MPKPRNLVQSERLLITTTPQVRVYLEALVATGLYGKNAPETAAQLLAGAIEERIREGTIKRLVSNGKRPTFEEGPTHDPSRP